MNISSQTPNRALSQSPAGHDVRPRQQQLPDNVRATRHTRLCTVPIVFAVSASLSASHTTFLVLIAACATMPRQHGFKGNREADESGAAAPRAASSWQQEGASAQMPFERGGV